MVSELSKENSTRIEKLICLACHESRQLHDCNKIACYLIVFHLEAVFRRMLSKQIEVMIVEWDPNLSRLTSLNPSIPQSTKYRACSDRSVVSGSSSGSPKTTKCPNLDYSSCATTSWNISGI
jgi:hypothetical protein